MVIPLALVLACAVAAVPGADFVPGARNEVHEPHPLELELEHLFSESAPELDHAHEVTRARSKRIVQLAAQIPEAFFLAVADGVLDTAHGTRVAPCAWRERELLAALGELPRTRQRTLIEQLAGADSAEPRRIAAFKLLAGFGGRAEFTWALATAAACGDPASCAEWVASARAALGAMLLRDERTFDLIRSRWSRMRREELVLVLMALGDTGDARALPILTEVLSRHTGVAGIALAQIPRFGVLHSCCDETLERLASAVRAHLASNDTALCQSAARALGALRDEAAVDDLVELLEVADAAVAHSANLALREITGIALNHDAELWRAWLAEERTWHGEHGQTALVGLDHPDPGVASRSIRLLSLRGLRRCEHARAIAPLREHASPAVRAAAEGALLRLTGPASSIER